MEFDVVVEAGLYMVLDLDIDVDPDLVMDFGRDADAGANDAEFRF